MLRTRPPRSARPSVLPSDLHALGTPPAFPLSQDQTLHPRSLHQTLPVLRRGRAKLSIDPSCRPLPATRAQCTRPHPSCQGARGALRSARRIRYYTQPARSCQGDRSRSNDLRFLCPSRTTLFQSPGRPRQAPSQPPQQSAPSAPRSPVPCPVLSVPLPKSLPPALPPQYHAGRA